MEAWLWRMIRPLGLGSALPPLGAAVHSQLVRADCTHLPLSANTTLTQALSGAEPAAIQLTRTGGPETPAN